MTEPASKPRKTTAAPPPVSTVRGGHSSAPRQKPLPRIPEQYVAIPAALEMAKAAGKDSDWFWQRLYKGALPRDSWYMKAADLVCPPGAIQSFHYRGGVADQLSVTDWGNDTFSLLALSEGRHHADGQPLLVRRTDITELLKGQGVPVSNRAEGKTADAGSVDNKKNRRRKRSRYDASDEPLLEEAHELVVGKDKVPRHTAVKQVSPKAKGTSDASKTTRLWRKYRDLYPEAADK